MLIEIKSRRPCKIIYSGEFDSLKLALEAAVESDAYLGGADLRGAYLGDADLRGAYLGGANLGDAYLGDADLRDAYLGGADLRGAYLGGADLRGANLGGADAKHPAVIETGETWTEYLTKVVPALLVAGGKTLDSFTQAWKCHNWNNCPMAHAFDVHDIANVPLLLRPRAEQFVRWFDAGLIPASVLEAKAGQK